MKTTVILEADKAVGIQLLYLPLCSSGFSSIEEADTKLKAVLKHK